MSDNYPEHLNPFAKDGKTKGRFMFGGSFRDFKRTIRRSFRIKKRDEEEVTIRQRIEPSKPAVVSYQEQQFLALPRSRFRERLSLKSDAKNPFEDEEKDEAFNTRDKRRRLKKRAPLPPKSYSSQDISEYTDLPSSGSNWSLTSGDTDYSYYDNLSRRESENSSSVILEKLKDFNYGMQKLKDDSNNNVIDENGDIKEKHSIPDVVISSPSDTEINGVEDLDNCEKNQETDDGKINPEDLMQKVETHNEDIELKNTNHDASNNNEEILDEDTKVEPINHEDTNNNNNNKVLYCEKEIYIVGSQDQLNEENTCITSISLDITGSRDDLDATSNNETIEQPPPMPKQRKNRLTKDTLLGIN